MKATLRVLPIGALVALVAAFVSVATGGAAAPPVVSVTGSVMGFPAEDHLVGRSVSFAAHTFADGTTTGQVRVMRKTAEGQTVYAHFVVDCLHVDDRVLGFPTATMSGTVVTENFSDREGWPNQVGEPFWLRVVDGGPESKIDASSGPWFFLGASSASCTEDLPGRGPLFGLLVMEKGNLIIRWH